MNLGNAVLIWLTVEDLVFESIKQSHNQTSCIDEERFENACRHRLRISKKLFLPLGTLNECWCSSTNDGLHYPTVEFWVQLFASSCKECEVRY